MRDISDWTLLGVCVCVAALLVSVVAPVAGAIALVAALVLLHRELHRPRT